MQRDPDKLPASAKASGLVWHRGDAISATDVAAAARDAAVIVHAVNPPGYRNWGELVLTMLDNTIAAARTNGARIVLPGTVYNFGPDAFPDLHETSPQNPVTVKGRIRVEMEKRLRAAAAGGASVLIVRAGDFFGPNAANNWFSQGLVKPGKTIRVITYPGRRGIGHQWAYLPDVAQTMVQLLEEPEALEKFAVFHMEGHWDADGAHNDRCRPQGCVQSQNQGPPYAVVAGSLAFADRSAVSRAVGNALPLGCAPAHGQQSTESCARLRATRRRISAAFCMTPARLAKEV